MTPVSNRPPAQQVITETVELVVAPAAIERALHLYEQLQPHDTSVILQARKILTQHIFGMVDQDELDEQKLIVGDHLGRLLKSRIAYHHSGLSYGARAGVIEPLAKAGQLRVVVATMGLAAGINFSLRSVALAGESYRRDYVEQQHKSDEILQMFGRAGRRGIDEMGYVLDAANEIRMRDGYPCQLARSGMADWSALLGLMSAASDREDDPFAEAVRVQERLFTSRPIFLGVEESMKHPDAPCGLKTDAERARRVRQRVREMLNSRGEWEPYPKPTEVPLNQVWICDLRFANDASPDDSEIERVNRKSEIVNRSVLTEPAALEKVGTGTLCVLSENDDGKIYGRAFTVADKLKDDRVVMSKWVRRLTGWNGRQAPFTLWNEKIVPLLEKNLAQQKTPVVRFTNHPHKIVAQVSLAELTMRAPVDSHGVALWKPQEREVLPPDCARCSLVPTCRRLLTATGTALLWRRLGLVDAAGVPTKRGRIVSFFQQGDGLAIAAALEDGSYPLDELIYDLADLDAGFRFCGEENRWAGRLAMACHERFGLQSIPGYLENGVPPKYGSGAEQIVASVHKNPLSKHTWVTDLLGVGDIDRVIIEWRSLLRQIAHAPDLDWPRWRALQKMAKAILGETESPTLTDLPPLEYHQTKRVDHRLILRRH